jgi:hypothetical protein
MGDLIGWNMEYWEQNEIFHLTFIFPTLGLEHSTGNFFKEFLKREGLVHFVPGMFKVIHQELLMPPVMKCGQSI